MARTLSVLFVSLALAGCTITHHEARGELDGTAVVLHWKSGDSAATLWRCGALPIPLTHGVTGDGSLQSDDACLLVFIEDDSASLESLDEGMSPVIRVLCEGPVMMGEHPLEALTVSRQRIWFGFREPEVPDPCTGN